jgi:UDP-2,3-diacylglucosamine pyrophosphatase LpxH
MSDISRQNPESLSLSPANGHYVVISDLHLGTGLHPQSKRWPLVEDFFFDSEFAAFLRKLEVDSQAGSPTFKWKLIINGDFAEFLQVLDLPGDPIQRPGGKISWPLEDYFYEAGTWIQRRLPDTVAGFAKEAKDGLATSGPKSAWKLKQIHDGHPDVFKALAEFLQHGHHIVLIKGNHDVEFYWPQVKKEFITLLCYSISCPLDKLAVDLGQWEREGFTGPRQIFCPGGTLEFCERTYEDDLVYVEHGNQYDPANAFEAFDKPINRVLREGEQFLDLPFGSIFVRYFFNDIESHFPDADNFKPTGAAIRRVWQRSRIGVALIVVKNFGRMLDALTFPPAWTRLWKTLNPAYITYLMAFLGLMIVYPTVRAFSPVNLCEIWRQEVWSDILRRMHGLYNLWTGAALVGSLLLSWFGDFILAGESEYLRRAACRICTRLRGNQRFIVFGHTHDPDSWRLGETPVWYFNTGTWTKVFSEEEALTRPGRQLTYVKVVNGKADLLEWTPEQRDPEHLMLLQEDTTPVWRTSAAFLEEVNIPHGGTPISQQLSYRLMKSLRRAKHLIEYVIGLPVRILIWPAICLCIRLVRIPYRLFKHIWHRRDVRAEAKRDVRALGYWLQASWHSLRDA